MLKHHVGKSLRRVPVVSWTFYYEVFVTNTPAYVLVKVERSCSVYNVPYTCLKLICSALNALVAYVLRACSAQVYTLDTRLR